MPCAWPPPWGPKPLQTLSRGSRHLNESRRLDPGALGVGWVWSFLSGAHSTAGRCH